MFGLRFVDRVRIRGRIVKVKYMVMVNVRAYIYG